MGSPPVISGADPCVRLRQAARNWNGAVAIECDAGKITYADLDWQVDQLAATIYGAGGQHGDVMAVYADGTPEFLVAALAVMRTGGVYAPLAPETPPVRLQHMLRELAPSLVLCAKRLDLACDLNGGGDKPRVVPFGEGLSRSHRETLPRNIPVAPGPDEPCYVYFTSGSTGKPKGIIGRRKGLMHFIDWEIGFLGLGAGVRVGSLLNPLFDAWLRDVFVALSCGGTIVVPPRREIALGGPGLVEWLERTGVHLIHCGPSVLRSMLPENDGSGSLPALRHILLAGEALSPVDLRRWHAAFSERIELINLYGQTETTMVKFCHRIRPNDGRRKRIPIGQPMTGCRAIILDDNNQPCPAGVPGHLFLRTPYTTLGYLNQPERTAAVFVANPLANNTADRVYRTGDLALMGDDGTFEYLGRSDYLVKIRGNRVELAEVEAAFREHPDLTDVVVATSETPKGETFLCVYFVATRAITPDELRRHASRFLPDYMIPAAFMRQPALPRLPNGKINRAELPRPILRSPRRRPPECTQERLLASIWSELLGCDDVGTDEDFFTLGGHSLTAMKLRARIMGTCGADVSLEMLYRHPTIERLARYLDSVPAAAMKLVRATPENGHYPLSSRQQRIFVEHERDRGGTAYNVSVAFKLDESRADLPRINAALTAVVRRHHALRTTFHATEVGLVQTVHEPFAAAAEYAEKAAPDVATMLADWIRPFTLGELPLFRFVVLKHRPSGALYALLDMHHIVTDAKSVEIFMTDLRRSYGGEELVPLEARYVDYAAWERQHMSSPEVRASLDYWCRRLAGVPLGFSPGPDLLPAEAAGTAGARRSIAIPAQTAAEIHAACGVAKVTPFMFFLGCWAVTLAERSEECVVIGTTVSARPFPELEEVVGFFGNEVAIPCATRETASFADFLAAMRETVLEAFRHQDAPYNEIVAGLRTMGATTGPLFRVKFQFSSISGLASDALSEGEAIDLYDGTAQNDLRLVVIERHGQFRCHLEFKTDIYLADRVQGWLERLSTIVAGAVASPAAPLRSHITLPRTQA